MVIVTGYEHGDTSSNPGPDFQHSTNTLGKGMNPNIGQTMFFSLGEATSLGEGKL